MRRFATLLLLLAAHLSFASSAHAQYSITDLGTLGGPSSIARAINARGDVAGWAYVDASTQHAFAWYAGSMHDLGTLGGANSYAYGINSMGLVVGASQTALAGAPQRPFRFEGGSMHDLGTLGGPTGAAYGINDRDETVGTSDTSPTFGNARGFLWHAGSMTDLGTLGGQFSVAFAINDVTQAVGTAFFAGNTVNHAARWNGGAGAIDLGTLGGTRGVATAINPAGAVAGYAQFSLAGSHERAFVRPAGGPANLDLGTLGGSDSQAWSINASGTIVGWSLLAGDVVRHAFFSNGSGMTDLNTLLPGGSGWVLNEAYGINDAGQIVGVGTHAGQSHAFLLSPATLLGVDGNAAAARFAGAYPNPAPGRATLAYALGASARIKLALYDVSGRQVRLLDQGERGAGQYSIAWDGRDEAGAAVLAGLYFARFEQAGEAAITRRVSVVR